MRRKPIFVLLGGGVILAAAVGAIAYLVLRPATLDVVVEAGSDEAAILTALGDELADDRASLRLRIHAVSNPDDVGKSFNADGAALAVLKSDAGMPADARAVAKFRDNAIVMVTRAGSKINSPADLAGHTIGLVGKDATSDQIALLSRQYDAGDKWQSVPLESDGLADAFDSGRIDAVAIVGVAGAQTTAAAVETMASDGNPPRFIPIDLADAFVQRNRLWDVAEIPAGTFKGNPARPAEALTTVSFGHYLVAGTWIKDDLVARLTRAIFELRPRLAQHIPAAALISAPSTNKDAALPGHPGALAYFNDAERTFFERYGDWIYIVAMAGTLIASLGASVGNYLGGADLRKQATARRLARLIARCAVAENDETLRRIEKEADAIAARTRAGVEAGKLSADSAASFWLSLDQIGRAVGRRRAELASRASA